MDLSPQGDLLITGSSEGQLKGWSIDYERLSKGVYTNDSGEVGQAILSPLTKS